MAKESYNHSEIEKKAQEKWASLDIYKTDLNDTEKDPYYLLVEFPYPSGDLHIGHWYAFGITDIYARFLRMQGKNVLFPFGFDAFGLPAENAAIKNGLDPKEWTYQNMDKMRTQMAQMGASFDVSKEVVTCDPGYYKWTQWLFSKFFEQGLAEHRLAAVKWCPHDMTVLANEQVIDGRCERCGHEVVEKKLTQWFLKITKYAERLLADLEPLPWPREIKDAQKAWIGKSEGAKIFFEASTIKNDDAGVIEVFTTRPDTIYGATYVVIAPDHALVDTFLPFVGNKEAVEAYRKSTISKTERERSENKDKTGVILEGVAAINPATNQELPVYIADYVLASYGTGAVMAVPAHDERDFEFAQKMGLPVVHVIDPITGDAQVDPKHKNKIVAVVEHEDKILTIKWPEELGGRLLVGGTAEDGEDAAVTAAREIAEETGYTDLELIEQADEQVHHSYFAFSKNQATIAHTTLLYFKLKSDKKQKQQLEENEVGKFTVEWISKEQAKNEIHDDQHLYALARFTDYGAYMGNGTLRNSGEFNGRDNEEAMWDIVSHIQGEKVTQYRLRDWLISRQRYWGCPIPIVYDPEGNPHLVPTEHLPWLLPEDVDFTPTGKAPLATSKELQERVERIFGAGWTPECDTLDTFVDSSWYFTRYLDSTDENAFSDQALMKKWLPVNRYTGGAEHTTMHLLYARFFYKALFDLALVPTNEPFYERFNRGLILGPDGAKMSKSKGNVINPDDVVAKYGADAVRTYLAFIGPYNEPGNYPWNLDGTEAIRRFLDRVARLVERVVDEKPTIELSRALGKATEKVAQDSERFKFNTAISALMIALKEYEKLDKVPRTAYIDFLKLLAPFAPHLSEYLYQTVAGEALKEFPSIHLTAWPVVASGLLEEESVLITVQVNGKRKASLQIEKDADEQAVVAAALEIKAIDGQVDMKSSRVVYVPNRIVNFVTGSTGK